jgi:hypothetical protein
MGQLGNATAYKGVATNDLFEKEMKMQTRACNMKSHVVSLQQGDDRQRCDRNEMHAAADQFLRDVPFPIAEIN